MIFNQHWMGASGNKWEEESTAKREIVTVSDYRELERKKETEISDLEFMLNVRMEASDAKALNVVLKSKSSWCIIINAGAVQWWKMNYGLLNWWYVQLSSTWGRCRSGATVAAQDTGEKAELSQGGKWEKSGKIFMTRYYFWINYCKNTSSDLWTRTSLSRTSLRGAPERLRGGALWGEICKYCFYF